MKKIWFEIAKMMFDYRIIETDGTLVFNNWCYEDEQSATAALEKIEDGGEPEGWFRHIETGRRRPNGDPEKEYVSQ